MTAECVAKTSGMIEHYLSARPRIPHLAQNCGMAEHHFQRRFAATTGETEAVYA